MHDAENHQRRLLNRAMFYCLIEIVFKIDCCAKVRTVAG